MTVGKLNAVSAYLKQEEKIKLLVIALFKYKG